MEKTSGKASLGKIMKRDWASLGEIMMKEKKEGIKECGMWKTKKSPGKFGQDRVNSGFLLEMQTAAV